jgi:pimeloyl-ACP methyl ester carboxylesterase
MLPSFYTDDGSGTPLLLCHAFPLNAAMWETQRHTLAGDCRLITFDIPGFGRGGAVDHDMDMHRCAELAINLLNHLGIERAVIGGCSMGGYIAMSLLRNYPDRVLGLLLANTRAGADSEEGRAARMAQIGRIERGELSVVLEEMLPKLLGEGTKNVAPEVVALVRKLMTHATADGCKAMLAAMAKREDSRQLLAECSLPVCAIGGAEDALIPAAETEQIAELAADSELHILPSAGHLSNLERPALFTVVVRHFLERFR